MIMKKIVIFIAALFSCCLAFTQETQKPLIVGTTSGYAPYVSLNARGEYEGFDIDFANLLGEKLGRKILIKDFGSMPSLMMALKQDKADMLIWAISITKERQQKMEMVHYQGKGVDMTPFLFWGSIPEGVKSVGDLEKISNGTICVEAGSSQEDILKAFPRLNLKYADKVVDVIMDLKYGKCLSTTIDPGLVAVYTEKYPQLKVAYLPIPEELKLYGNGVAISKKNKALADEVRKAVDELAQEGKIEDLEKKWNITE